MVDGDYVRLSAACHCGVLLPKRLGRGRPLKSCEEHKGKQRQKFEPRKCPGCAAEFSPSKYDQLYCTRRCGARVRRGSKLAKAKKPKTLARPIKIAPEDVAAWVWYAEQKHARAAKSIECVDCGAKLCPLYGSKISTRCPSCSDANVRVLKSKYGAVRRLRVFDSQSENVDPHKVFHAAGWKCQICGVDTPRSKRGTYDDDAPELDHIRPLAKGGEHSYTNVQCACRKCNAKKSDSWQSEPSTPTALPSP